MEDFGYHLVHNIQDMGNLLSRTRKPEVNKLVGIIDNNLRRIFIVVFISLYTLPQKAQEPEQVPQIIRKPVIDLLKYDLWSQENAYDAAHFLMVPMHFAYKNNDAKLIKAFDSFFHRFILDKKNFLEIENHLIRLQFNYLISQFLVQRYDSNQKSNDLDKYLVQHLNQELKYYYFDAEVTNWKYPDNDNYEFLGIRNRIFWKLTSDLDPSYYKKAIVDEDLFLIGIAGDLKRLNSSIENSDPEPYLMAALSEINTLAYVIFASRFEVFETGMIFQPGYFFRHRDFRYAGCLTIECIEKGPSPVKDIAADTSHSHRLPLILSSMEAANINDKALLSFYQKTKRGLAKQFNNKVVTIEQEGKVIHFTNYFDGRNGYYRWDYQTNRGEGYGPYELSETFKLGWWSFLEDAKINSIYAQVSNNLERSVPEEFEYQDKTSRARNPIIERRYENGLYMTITSMASKLQ